MQVRIVVITILVILAVASASCFETDDHTAYARSSHHKTTTYHNTTNYEKIIPELKIKNQ